jgi:hypothetical protein
MEDIMTQVLKGPSPAFESMISARLDAALQIPSFANFPLEILSRILNNRARVLNNHHALYKFILNLLDQYKSDASGLISALDLRQMTTEEALQILEHPHLTKTVSVESSAALIRQYAAVKKELEENKTVLNEICARLDILEQKTAPSVKKTEDRVETRKTTHERKRAATIRPVPEEKPKPAVKRTGSAGSAGKKSGSNKSKAKDSVVEEVPLENVTSVGILQKLANEAQGNVHQTGVVEITASSSDHNLPYQVADAEWEEFWFSQNKPDQWIMFDFKNKKVRISEYRIKTHRFGSDSCHLKCWKLQGSNDGTTWTDLDQRDTDVLNAAKRVEKFECTGVSFSARYLRLVQTGRNNRGDNLLALTNIDFFGTIVR